MQAGKGFGPGMAAGDGCGGLVGRAPEWKGFFKTGGWDRAAL